MAPVDNFLVLDGLERGSTGWRASAAKILTFYSKFLRPQRNSGEATRKEEEEALVANYRRVAPLSFARQFVRARNPE